MYYTTLCESHKKGTQQYVESDYMNSFKENTNVLKKFGKYFAIQGQNNFPRYKSWNCLLL